MPDPRNKHVLHVHCNLQIRGYRKTDGRTEHSIPGKGNNIRDEVMHCHGFLTMHVIHLDKKVDACNISYVTILFNKNITQQLITKLDN